MGIESALALIATKDDHCILHAVEYLHRQLLDVNDNVVDELLDNLPAQSTEKTNIQALVEDSKNNYDEPLSDAESVRFSRRFLVALAQQSEASRRLIAHSLESWPDDEQSVGKVLARGTVVTLLLVSMSTAVTYESGPLKIEKKTLNADEIRAFGEVASSLIGELLEPGVKRSDDSAAEPIKKK